MSNAVIQVYPSVQKKAKISRGEVLGFSFAGYVLLASQSHCPIIVFFVASYRPHLSHFWENVIFAIPTKSLSIYAFTLFWTGGFALLCNWFIEVVVSRTKCNAR